MTSFIKNLKLVDYFYLFIILTSIIQGSIKFYYSQYNDVTFHFVGGSITVIIYIAYKELIDKRQD